jgi:DNA-binding NarL/FixJ family response regulator
VQLLLDTPVGFALSYLGAETGTQKLRTLVVTDSLSQPYLHDLLAAEPQGVVVGAPGDAALALALERVAGGETFYEGPALEASDLYPREREVWRLVVRGLSNAQIAAQLSIREKTVANYVTSLQDKLFLKNRVELVLFYLGKLERPA